MSMTLNNCLEIQADPRGENWSDSDRKHATECPLCVPYLESCVQLRGRLQTLPSARETMPTALRDRMLQQLADTPVAETAQPRPKATLLAFPIAQRFLVPTALAATLVLGVFLGSGFDFKNSPFPVEVEATIGMYIADVTHDHYLLERIARPLEVEITDPADLSSWLSASLNFPMQLPESSGSLALQGGRVWHTVGRLSALASYATASGSRLVLFAVPAENLKLQDAESSYVGSTLVFTGEGWGYEARIWIDGDLAVALTAPEGELPAEWNDIFLP